MAGRGAEGAEPDPPAARAPLLKWGFALYGEEGLLWHQRLVAGRVVSCPDEVVMLSPDGDLYVERWFGEDAEAIAVRFFEEFRPREGRLPGRVCRFRQAPTVARLRAVLEEARTVADEHFAERFGANRLPAEGGARVGRLGSGAVGA